MRRFISKQPLVVAVGLAALGLSYFSGPVQAQGLPPGAHLEVVAEYPSTDPGIEKIVINKFTLDPGAKVEDFTPSVAGLCIGAQGEGTVVTADGKTVIRKAGQTWTEPKGIPFTMSNKGTIPFVDIFVNRIPRK